MVPWTDTAGSGGSGQPAANVGTGAGLVFRDKTSVTLNLKTLKAGTGVTITNNTDDITLDTTGAGGGEVNTASNFGSSGTGLWKDKNGAEPSLLQDSVSKQQTDSWFERHNHMDLTVVKANLAIAYSQLTSVPTEIVKTNQANTYSSGVQLFQSSNIKIRNPADTFSYTIVAAAISR